MLFSPVNSQATQSGTNFFSIDCGRILSSLFCASGQFIQTFKLMHQGHAIFAFSRLSQFFYQFDNVREVSAVQKFGCHSNRRLVRVSSHSCTLSVTVSALDIKLGKSLLAFRQSSRPTDFPYSVFCGFSLLFFHFSSHDPLVSVTVIQKWYSCKRCVIRVVSLVPLYHLISNFFKKKVKAEKNFIVRCILLLTIPCNPIRLDMKLSYYIGGQVI